MYSGDFGTPYCDGGVVFFGTMYQWEVQNTGTLNFDWVYSTDDSSPFWDPFGYSLGVDWSTTVATVGNLLANTNLLIEAGFGDPTDQNGTAQIDLFAGDIFALIVFTRDAFGGEAQVDFSNVFFGEAGATLTINEGPAPGEDFCLGDTDVDFDVNLANGEVVNCQFTVTVF